MPIVHVNSADLHYELDNYTNPWTKPQTFFLQHGFCRNSRFWYKWVPLLAGQFQILRPDLRGLGRSSMPPELYQPSSETFTADFISLLDHLNIDQVVYVGEALGGILGLIFASAHPERIRALVLTSTPLRVPQKEWMKKFPLREGSWEAALAKGVDNWSRQTIGQRIDLNLAPPQLVEWWIGEMGKTITENAVKLNRYVASLDLTPHLSQIKVPTLILVGEEWPGITPQEINLMRTRITDVKVVTFPSVGCSVHAVMAERCVQEVLTFLSERSLLSLDS